MPDAPTREEVDQLRAEVAALRRRCDRPRRRRRPLLPVVCLAALLALVPLAAGAAITFDDLNPGSAHNANIQAIADAGITTGCVPGVSYCPNDLVTREQMASFLARTAGLGANPPVAHALTAETAGNAAQLGGQPAGFYQAANQPIANATSAGHAATADNAATVGGYAPNGLVRAAFVDKTSGFPALVSTAAPVATLAIAIPAAGFLLVTSTLAAYGGSGSCFVYHYMRDEASHGPSFGSGHPSGTDFYGGSSQNFVFSVAPRTRTITVLAARDIPPGGACAVALSEVLISAVFVPFGSTGGSTLDAP